MQAEIGSETNSLHTFFVRRRGDVKQLVKDSVPFSVVTSYLPLSEDEF